MNPREERRHGAGKTLLHLRGESWDIRQTVSGRNQTFMWRFSNQMILHVPKMAAPLWMLYVRALSLSLQIQLMDEGGSAATSPETPDSGVAKLLKKGASVFKYSRRVVQSNT